MRLWFCNVLRCCWLCVCDRKCDCDSLSDMRSAGTAVRRLVALLRRCPLSSPLPSGVLTLCVASEVVVRRPAPSFTSHCSAAACTHCPPAACGFASSAARSPCLPSSQHLCFASGQQPSQQPSHLQQSAAFVRQRPAVLLRRQPAALVFPAASIFALSAASSLRASSSQQPFFARQRPAVLLRRQPAALAFPAASIFALPAASSHRTAAALHSQQPAALARQTAASNLPPQQPAIALRQQFISSSFAFPAASSVRSPSATPRQPAAIAFLVAASSHRVVSLRRQPHVASSSQQPPCHPLQRPSSQPTVLLCSSPAALRHQPFAASIHRFIGSLASSAAQQCRFARHQRQPAAIKSSAAASNHQVLSSS